MDSLIFELQIVFYFQLFLSANVRHRLSERNSDLLKKSQLTFLLHEFFSSPSSLHEFFSWHFPSHEFFLVPPPAPHHFSNGPSLICIGRKRLQTRPTTPSSRSSPEARQLRCIINPTTYKTSSHTS